MGKAEIEACLMWLVATRNVSSSTHRQALSALLFLYGKVLGVELPWLNPVAMVATGNLRYIGMIKLTGVEINESDPLIFCLVLLGRLSLPSQSKVTA